MRNKCLPLLYILLVICSWSSLTAQEFDDDGEVGFYGYTSIYYSPGQTGNNVTAYVETDLYGPSSYYYVPIAAVVSNGYSASYTGETSDLVDISVYYPGTAGQTYVAYGTHSLRLNPKEPIQDDDYYGAEEWGPYDISEAWQFPFTAFAEETDEDPDIPVTLGETFDAALVDIPASCGDQRTTIIQEYVSYNTPYFPQCSEFTQSSTDPALSFQTLNSGTYTWAILRSYFISNLESLASLTSYTVNSAYRNPAKEYSVATSVANGKYHPGSRHQYGDAVDVASNSSTWANYQSLGHQLSACVEPISVQGNYNHAHLDWRTKATVGPTTTVCPNGW